MVEALEPDIISQQFESAGSVEELAQLWAEYLATKIRADAPLGSSYIRLRYKTLLKLCKIEPLDETELEADAAKREESIGTAVGNFAAATKAALFELGISQKQLEDWVRKHRPNIKI